MFVQLKRIGALARYLLHGRFDYLYYAMWTRWKGLDFRPLSVEELGLSSDRSHHHAASGGVFLADVLRRIEIGPGSRVVDFGCGKGSAVCTLAEFPFERIVGVELSPAMARIAEENVRKLALTNVEICVCDAAQYKDLDQFTHVYLFNPFPCAVTAEVMANLAQSLVRKPRKLTIIYYFPVCHDTIMRSGLFRKQIEVDTPILPVIVYAHDQV